jgi:L-asparaginase / beta-aspartyl-peptidase
MRIVPLLFLMAAAAATAEEPAMTADHGYAIAIHGGAGTLSRADIDEAREASIRMALNDALDAGATILAAGGSSLDAVTAATAVLEDSPHFNAGHGAVFNAEGVNELDASIMEGHTRRAGAVAGVHRVRNPIRLARAVMEQSAHVMLIGEGAEVFARGAGIELVEPAYFRTEHRWDQLLRAREREQQADAERAADAGGAVDPDRYFGTVGAVARDRNGHLAAATSTGGMTNKRWGRVGDSPVIGAGTWADAGCAVSATGWGEFFIRLGVAQDICARVAYAKQSLAAAAGEVMMKDLPALGGDGGVIAIDAEGKLALPFNPAGIYRGGTPRDGSRATAIFSD